MAHLDETGYIIREIGADGRLALAKKGSFYDSVLLERPLVIHARRGPVTGVLTVPNLEEPGGLVFTVPEERLVLDIGAATAGQAEAAGVRVGDMVTVPKSFERLGPHRGYGRSVDDRAGCAALTGPSGGPSACSFRRSRPAESPMPAGGWWMPGRRCSS